MEYTFGAQEGERENDRGDRDDGGDRNAYVYRASETQHNSR